MKIFTLLEENVEEYQDSYNWAERNYADSTRNDARLLGTALYTSAASDLILSTFTQMHFCLTVALMM